jgi:catechol 2,3-dioxygenase-like lactoylglutathione lyase family enzyme
MRIHHVAIFVTGINKSLTLYRDLLGFEVFVDTEIPDGTYFEQGTIDDIFKTTGSRSRMVMLRSHDGTLLELQQPSVPAIQRTPDAHLRSGYTGISELAFVIEDIDKWFDRIRDARYETQTEYVWDYSIGRSLLFYDPDGNMLQFIEEREAAA